MPRAPLEPEAGGIRAGIWSPGPASRSSKASVSTVPSSRTTTRQASIVSLHLQIQFADPLVDTGHHRDILRVSVTAVKRLVRRKRAMTRSRVMPATAAPGG